MKLGLITTSIVGQTKMKFSHFKSKVKSQATIEMAFIVTLFFTMVLVILFIAINIYRTQILASAVREGASTTARITANNIDAGLKATLSIATSGFRFNDFMTNGLIIITKMQNYTNNLYLSGFSTVNTVGITGYLAGTNDTANKDLSKLLLGGSWTTPLRPGVPEIMKLTNTVVQGKDLYCVEIFYTNRAPLNILGFSESALLYDKSFFMSP